MSDIDKLRAFAQAVLDGWPDVPQWDGFDLQDLAVKHGLLEATTVTEFCGEGCQCAEVNEFPMECFRFTALLKGPTQETSAVRPDSCHCPSVPGEDCKLTAAECERRTQMNRSAKHD